VSQQKADLMPLVESVCCFSDRHCSKTILKRDAFPVASDQGFRGVLADEHLEAILVTDLLVGINVNPDGHA